MAPRQLLRIRAVMNEADMREVAGASTRRPRLRGNGLHVEVVSPTGEVLGILAVTSITIECAARTAPVTALVRCDVAEIDLLAERVLDEPFTPGRT